VFSPVSVVNDDGVEELIIEDSKYFPDVTQNPNINFFVIPKLGAYLALPLSYRNILTETALDEGIKERRRVKEKREEQKKDWEE